MAAVISGHTSVSSVAGHARWVRVSHWILAASVLTLAFSGFEILMSHPRLYWGQAGNDLTPALFELPISRNYHHGGWEKSVPFYHTANSPVSAGRTYDIFNDNGIGRSSHFLAAWLLVITGLLYFIAGIFSGHFRKNLLSGIRELGFMHLWHDLVNHFRKQTPGQHINRQYGLLQRITYLLVIFFLFPVVILTGLTMSPAVTAS